VGSVVLVSLFEPKNGNICSFETLVKFYRVTQRYTHNIALFKHSFVKPQRFFMLYSGVTSFPFQSVSPGVVATEFMAASGRPVDPERLYSSIAHLEAKDVADAVLYVLGVPPHVQVRTGLVFKTSRAQF
jgi:hypothetical protein